MVKSEEAKLKKILEAYLTPNSMINQIKTSKEHSIQSIETAVDIILILSNSNFPERKPALKMNELRELCSILKFTNIDEATKDKIDALETFCFW